MFSCASGVTMRVTDAEPILRRNEMSVEDNKAIARRHFEEFWTKGELGVADEIYAPGAVGHCGNLPDQTGYPECEKELVRQDRVAFPDGTATVEDQIAEADKVLTRWRFRGTNTSPLYGNSASGQEVSVSGFHVHRIVDGKIVEIWALGDFYSLLHQIGALQPQQTEVV
jgi:predicted ester cyclase